MERIPEDRANSFRNGSPERVQPAVAAAAAAAGHRRHRSRGGGGGHSRSESLVESLADIVDVLQTIDEVHVDRSALASSRTVDDDDTGNANAHVSPTPDDDGNNGRLGRHRGRSRGDGHSRTASMSEGLLEEALDVRDALVEELDDADGVEKQFFFLEMNLARHMSLLPEDVVRVAEATAPPKVQLEGGTRKDASGAEAWITDPEKHSLIGDERAAKTHATAAGIPLNAYFLLVSAIFSLSSVGPLLNVQTGVNPVLKVYWRMSATAMVLFPLAAGSVYKEGGIRSATKTLHGPQVVTLFFTAACYATMCVAFVLALQYTAVGNAVILSNSQAVLLLIGKIFVGQRILALEASGALLAFAGAVMCSFDSADGEETSPLEDDMITSFTNSTNTASTIAGGSNHMTLLGDALALLSALAGVFYLTFAKAVRPNLNLYLFMFLVMFCGSSLILLCMLVYAFSSHHSVYYSSDFRITIDCNIVTGIWGWINWRIDRLPLEFTMVVLCNIFGAMGYVRAMQYFDNLIIAVATLLEPVIATLAAVILGVGLLPGSIGWVGNVMVALGTFAVVYPSASSGKGAGSH